MGDAASIELCRKLFELSDWNDTRFYYLIYDSPLVGRENLIYRSSIDPINFGGNKFPAYDLGYLLRKLPAHVSIHKLGKGKEGQFYVEYHKTPFGDIREYSDTPEDAAAKLAITLFKQNILQRSTS